MKRSRRKHNLPRLFYLTLPGACRHLFEGTKQNVANSLNPHVGVRFLVCNPTATLSCRLRSHQASPCTLQTGAAGNMHARCLSVAINDRYFAFNQRKQNIPVQGSPKHMTSCRPPPERRYHVRDSSRVSRLLPLCGASFRVPQPRRCMNGRGLLQ